MDKFMDIDDLEAFVLDFLAYRRERRATTLPKPGHSPPKLIEYKPEQAEPPTLPQAHHIPHSIGKGWPHYKTVARDIQPLPPPEPVISTSQSDIIPTLTPIVSDALNRFGEPQTPKALEHLVCQVIANAMAIPLISESMNTAEITSWGRVPLLQAVVELLIILQMKQNQ